MIPEDFPPTYQYLSFSGGLFHKKSIGILAL
jgi:hypothetical protein